MSIFKCLQCDSYKYDWVFYMTVYCMTNKIMILLTKWKCPLYIQLCIWLCLLYDSHVYDHYIDEYDRFLAIKEIKAK